MKHFLSTILLLVCTQSYGSELSLLDASLFQYAASNTELPSEINRELIAKTTTLCEQIIIDQRCTEIFARLAPELGLLTDAPPRLVAQALAELIFKKPSQAQILYTLTQLTLASGQVPLHESVDTKADFVIHAVRAGLDPLIKSPISKVPTTWIYIGTGITIGTMLIIGIWYFVVKQRQATTALAHNQEELLAHVEELEHLMETSIRETNACQDELEVLDDEIEAMAADMVKLDQKVDATDDNATTHIARVRAAAQNIQATAQRAHALATVNQRLLAASCKQNKKRFKLTQNVLTDIYKQRPASRPMVDFNRDMDDAPDLEVAVNTAIKRVNEQFPENDAD